MTEKGSLVHHVNERSFHRGRFSVIDGPDGSGKHEQSKRLAERLRAEGHAVTEMDFPRYGNAGAYFVEGYLTGRYGNAVELHPEVASLFYAVDRQFAAPAIREALGRGDHVIANRYTSSNVGHQGGKAETPEERDRIIDFINWLEFDLMGIPKPDKNIFLHVPAVLGQRLVDLKDKRSYTTSERDGHEMDLDHLRAAERTYQAIAERENWSVVECLRHPRFSENELLTLPVEELMRSREEIHEDVYSAFRSRGPDRRA